MNEELILDKKKDEIHPEDDLQRVSYVKKFHSLVKEYLEIEISKQLDPLLKVKETSRFVSFSLPANLSEVFLRADESQILWILDTPLNNYIEDYFKIHFSKSAGFDFFKLVKENYQKWIFNKSLSEKKYFARSFMSLAEKNFASNFYFYLLLSSVFTHEKSVMSYSKAFEALAKAKELVMQNKLTESHRDDLVYNINLLTGFLHLKEGDTLSANESFTEATRVNPFGITSKFYLALTELRLNHIEVVQHLIKEIINFDKFRCTHAINTYNAGMLNYFIKYPITSNIFYYDDFSSVHEVIEQDFVELRLSFNDCCSILAGKIKNLEEMKLSEFYNDETSKILYFLIQVINGMGKSKSVIFSNCFNDLQAKFALSINNITQTIKEKFYNEVDDKLALYNSQIEEKVKEAEKLKGEQDEYIKKLKDKLKEAVDRLEKSAANEIAQIEDKINNINDVASLSPKNSFGKSMTYNFIISILVFMMGGCAGYTDTFMYSTREVKDVVGIIVISGIKWGGISFLSGILISFAFASFIIIQRSNQKQKYIKHISYIKEQKEIQVEAHNKDYSASEKTILNNFGKRIADKNDDAKHLGEEREKQEKVLQVEANEKIQEEIKKLEALL